MIKTFGHFDGEEVLEATLHAGAHSVSIINYGAVVRDWQFRSIHERTAKSTLPLQARRLVLGFENFEPYPLHSPSFGIIAGRVANRTRDGQFDMAGKTWQLTQNENSHHLHGGIRGLGKRVWRMEPDSAANAVRLFYHSPAGEQGYPCTVEFEVVYTLCEHGLHCDMYGMPDGCTPINLAQHNYYNLDRANGSIRQHQLQMDLTHYIPVDAASLPAGHLASVDGGGFDYRQFRRLADADPQSHGQDHNVVLREDRNIILPAATLRDSASQVQLDIITDQPGIQLYTGAKLNVPVAGLAGEHYGAYSGVCLEPQHFPDTLNHPQWPSIMCTPESPYKQAMIMKVTDLAVK